MVGEHSGNNVPPVSIALTGKNDGSPGRIMFASISETPVPESVFFLVDKCSCFAKIQTLLPEYLNFDGISIAVRIGEMGGKKGRAKDHDVQIMMLSLNLRRISLIFFGLNKLSVVLLPPRKTPAPVERGKVSFKPNDDFSKCFLVAPLLKRSVVNCDISNWAVVLGNPDI